MKDEKNPSRISGLLQMVSLYLLKDGIKKVFEMRLEKVAFGVSGKGVG